MNDEPKPQSATALLLASRRKDEDRDDPLIAALGEIPVVVNGVLTTARHRRYLQLSQSSVIQAATGPVVEDASLGIRSLQSPATLGEMVRSARKAMKMSQSHFAAHAGVGRRFVSELESGKESVEFGKALACAAAAGIDLWAQSRRD